MPMVKDMVMWFKIPHGLINEKDFVIQFSDTGVPLLKYVVSKFGGCIHVFDVTALLGQKNILCFTASLDADVNLYRPQVEISQEIQKHIEKVVEQRSFW